METSLFNILADDEFRLRAFADFLQRCQEKYSRMLEAIAAIPDYCDRNETGDEFTEWNLDQCNQVATQILNEFELNDGIVCLPTGYTNLRALLVFKIHFDRASLAHVGTDQDLLDTDSFTVSAYDVHGNVANDLTINNAELGSYLQGNLHSITCLWATVKAKYDKITGNISDVISNFNDTISDVFANCHVDLSNSLKYCKELLTSRVSNNEFVEMIIDKIGINKESDISTSDDYNLSKSDMGAYTGASPSAALDFSTAGKVIATSCYLAAVAVKGIINGVIGIVKGVFNWATNKIREIAVNPNDLYVSNESGAMFIDGFYYKKDYTDTIIYELINQDDPSTDTVALTINKMKDKWYFIRTIFSEMMFKIIKYVKYQNFILANFTILYKPKVQKTCPHRIFRGFSDYQDWVDLIQKDFQNEYSKQQREDIKNTVEGSLYLAMEQNIYLDWKFANLAYKQCHGHTLNSGDSDDQVSQGLGQWDCDLYPNSHITNVDWLRLACGWDPEQDDWVDFIQFKTHDPDFRTDISAGDRSDHFPSGMSITDTGRWWMSGIIRSATIEDNTYSVGDETPFIPYSIKEKFSDGKFSIKTDQQNQAVFNAFINGVALAVVIVITSLVIGIAIKRRRKAKFMKYTAIAGQLDNKMWSGQTLTAKEKRQYIRAQRKLSKIDLFSSSLVPSSISGAVSNNDGAVVNSDVLQLQGTTDAHVQYVNDNVTGLNTNLTNRIKTVRHLIDGHDE